MRPDGWDDGPRGPRTRLVGHEECDRASESTEDRAHEPVFDFTGLDVPDLCDLALILTARLRSEPGERVWVTALPEPTWRVLRVLGLDHLFQVLPRSPDVPN